MQANGVMRNDQFMEGPLSWNEIIEEWKDELSDLRINNSEKNPAFYSSGRKGSENLFADCSFLNIHS